MIRILKKNYRGTAASITASSSAGAMLATNLLSLKKYSIWRSASLAAQDIVVTWNSSIAVSGVVFAFCNFSSAATMRVRCFSEPADVAEIYDSGNVLCCRRDRIEDVGVNFFGVGGGIYASVFFATQTAKKVQITISDPANAQGYVEASQVLVGDFWSPAHGFNWGAETGCVSLGQISRSQAGSAIKESSAFFKSIAINFDLLTEIERIELTGIIKANKNNPLYVSAFPGDTQKEQDYQILGYLEQTSKIINQSYGVFSSSIDIEEM